MLTVSLGVSTTVPLVPVVDPFMCVLLKLTQQKNLIKIFHFHVIFTLSGTCEKKQKVYLLNYQNPPVLAPNWILLFVSNS